MRDGCLGGGWWALGRDGRVLVTGAWVLEPRRGLGVLTQHVEKSVEKSGRPEKFILLEIPRKAAAAALKHGNSPTESGTPEG